MKKLLALILATMLLFVACDPNIGGDVPSTPGSSDTPVGPGPGPDDSSPENYNTEFNFIVAGDFDAFNGTAVTEFNWGGTNETASIVEEEGNNVVKMSAPAEGDAFIFYNSVHDFTGTDVKLSARMKLSNAEDAENATLVLEFVGNDGSSVIENASFSSKPQAVTDWQDVSVELTVDQMSGIVASKTTAKVLFSSAAEGTLLVDDVTINVKDVRKVNFFGNGHLNGPIDGKYVTTGTTPWPSADTVENGRSGATDKAISFDSSDNELFVTSQWWADGNQALRFPTTEDGEFSVWAKGDGSFAVLIERKNNDSDIDISVSKTFTATSDAWTECSLLIPASKEYKEVTVKIYQYTGSDALLLDDFCLHLTQV